jgi:hypothetical protein
MAQKSACDTEPMNDSGARDPAFWQLAHLSNRQLLDGLGARLRSSREALAELVAHLGEVEERRLHLHAGCGSMFDYCVKRLGLSEDEACRRIDAARLARRFPAIFPLLASGKLSMTVAALLKPHLDETNAPRLLAAVSGCSTAQAREVLVSFFPRPDVPTRLRKLPERHPAPAPSVLIPAPVAHQVPAVEGSATPSQPPGALAAAASIADQPPTVPARIESLAAHPAPSPPTRGGVSAPARIEPLAPARYKLQLTASADLKAKLELARDLLWHAVPSGDYGAIIERALDLLIVDVRKRRFGVGARARKSAPAVTRAAASDTAGAPGTDATAPGTDAAAAGAAPFGRYVPRAVRRSVAERDGQCCSWMGGDGRRCGERAWLEYDHRDPHGKGEGSGPENMRLYCRAHNRLAAELEYGKDEIARAIRNGRRRSGFDGEGGRRSETSPA